MSEKIELTIVWGDHKGKVVKLDPDNIQKIQEATLEDKPTEEIAIVDYQGTLYSDGDNLVTANQTIYVKEKARDIAILAGWIKP